MSTIRTNIREAIKTKLKAIISGNDSGAGYLFVNTIRNNNIGDPPTTVERMKEFPFINIYYGVENCANSNIGKALQTGGNKQLWHNSVDITFDCFMKDMLTNLSQDNMLADLQALFGNDYTVNDTVFTIAYIDSEPFGMELNVPNCGITVRFRIWYRIFQTNPNISG